MPGTRVFEKRQKTKLKNKISPKGKDQEQGLCRELDVAIKTLARGTSKSTRVVQDFLRLRDAFIPTKRLIYPIASGGWGIKQSVSQKVSLSHR